MFDCSTRTNFDVLTELDKKNFELFIRLIHLFEYIHTFYAKYSSYKIILFTPLDVFRLARHLNVSAFIDTHYFPTDSHRNFRFRFYDITISFIVFVIYRIENLLQKKWFSNSVVGVSVLVRV